MAGGVAGVDAAAPLHHFVPQPFICRRVFQIREAAMLVRDKIEIVAMDMHAKMNGCYTLEGCFEFVRHMPLDELNATFSVIRGEG